MRLPWFVLAVVAAALSVTVRPLTLAEITSLVQNVVLDAPEPVTRDAVVRFFTDGCTESIDRALRQYNVTFSLSHPSLRADWVADLITLYGMRHAVDLGSDSDLRACARGEYARCVWMDRLLYGAKVCPQYRADDLQTIRSSLPRHEILGTLVSAAAAFSLHRPQRLLLSLDDIDVPASNSLESSLAPSLGASMGGGAAGTRPNVAGALANVMSSVGSVVDLQSLQQKMQPLIKYLAFRSHRRLSQEEDVLVQNTWRIVESLDLTADEKNTLMQALSNMRAYGKRLAIKIYSALPIEKQFLGMHSMSNVDSAMQFAAYLKTSPILRQVRAAMRPSASERSELMRYALAETRDDGALDIVLAQIPDDAITAEQRRVLKKSGGELAPVMRFAAILLSRV